MSDKELIEKVRNIGYTQRVLAMKFDYNECYLSNVLNGKLPLSKKMRKKLQDFADRHKNI